MKYLLTLILALLLSGCGPDEDALSTPVQGDIEIANSVDNYLSITWPNTYKGTAILSIKDVWGDTVKLATTSTIEFVNILCTLEGYGASTAYYSCETPISGVEESYNSYFQVPDGDFEIIEVYLDNDFNITQTNTSYHSPY